jgi:hypothetical protein
LTFRRSSGVLKGPDFVRYSTMAFASADVIPGHLPNWSAVALFKSTFVRAGDFANFLVCASAFPIKRNQAIKNNVIPAIKAFFILIAGTFPSSLISHRL